MLNVSLGLIKFIAAAAIFVMTVIAGAIPFKQRIKNCQGLDFPSGEALACGVFLGAGLIHMLGDASSSFTDAGYHYPYAFLLAGSCFLLLLLLEHISSELARHKSGSSPALALLVVVMLSIHALLAGTALGLSFNLTELLVISLAILAHKWAESFALSVQINKSTLTPKQGIRVFAIFSLMTPLGIAVGGSIVHFTNAHSLVQPIFSSLAAGTILYIGTLHGLAKSILIKDCCDLKQFSLVVLGFGLMAVVAIWT